MKRVAIVQSNYIPWKGYFDLIASVDEFVILDDVQFTRRDWRNRNRIKTPRGVAWLSVPVGDDIKRHIRDVRLSEGPWRDRHWQALEESYRMAPFFDTVAAVVEPILRRGRQATLSGLNREILEAVNAFLGIRTRISNAWDYESAVGRTERLAAICAQAGAGEYLSGPAAKAYLDERIFRARGIGVRWMDYSGYPEYPQLWGAFVHEVSVLDLLFNCGQDSPRYMKSASR